LVKTITATGNGVNIFNLCLNTVECKKQMTIINSGGIEKKKARTKHALKRKPVG
jgi:hypothetical protein